MEKDSVFTGMVLGALVPVIGFILVDQLFEWMTQFGLLESTIGEGISRRERTLALIAICFNLIPFNYGKRNRFDATMRGVVFPTLIYVGFWLYKYANILF